MKTFKFLFVANIFFKTCMVLISLALIALIILFIHTFISPESYDKIVLEAQHGIGYNYTNHNHVPPVSYAEYIQLKDKNFYFNKLTLGTKISILMHFLLGVGFILLVFKELNNFLTSVKEYSSFFVNNHLYFKRIGIYFSIMLLWNIINNLAGIKISMKFPDGYIDNVHHYYNISYYIVMCAIIILVFIASLVFKEGERLRIENDLTV
jgi:hypothetical protein